MLVYEDANVCKCNIIDFGWAILFKDDLDFRCPLGLGDSFAPDYMYSDFYSFGKLIKQILGKCLICNGLLMSL